MAWKALTIVTGGPLASSRQIAGVYAHRVLSVRKSDGIIIPPTPLRFTASYSVKPRPGRSMLSKSVPKFMTFCINFLQNSFNTKYGNLEARGVDMGRVGGSLKYV